MLLQQIDRVRRGVLPPYGIEELLARYRPIRVEQQHRQHHALLNRTQGDIVNPSHRPQRPQHVKSDTIAAANIHHGAPPTT
jgi:hypothetical protein